MDYVNRAPIGPLIMSFLNTRQARIGQALLGLLQITFFHKNVIIDKRAVVPVVETCQERGPFDLQQLSHKIGIWRSDKIPVRLRP